MFECQNKLKYLTIGIVFLKRVELFHSDVVHLFICFLILPLMCIHSFIYVSNGSLKEKGLKNLLANSLSSGNDT